VEGRTEEAGSAAPADEERRGPLRIGGLVVAVLLAGGLIALLLYGVLTKAPNTTIDDALARHQATPAPAYRLPVLRAGTLGPVLAPRLRAALADDAVESRELRGTPYVLNFWASWCVPCREEAPRLQHGWRQSRPRGVLFVGLNMQDVTDDANDFLDTFGIDYLNIRDRSNDVARRYGLTGIPETYFVSARGNVVGHVIGVVSADQLREGIRAAISGRPRASREGGARKPAR
jgi:cytochrome c biogenesis protein CcmG/thiol:disulfide interchange protein DsbE